MKNSNIIGCQLGQHIRTFYQCLTKYFAMLGKRASFIYTKQRILSKIIENEKYTKQRILSMIVENDKVTYDVNLKCLSGFCN